MALSVQGFLFKWEEVDARSDLDRLWLVLEVLPDEALVRKLEAARGRGQADFRERVDALGDKIYYAAVDMKGMPQ